MSILILISRYVRFDVETALKKGFPLRGETPFDAKGDFSVKENGDFHCQATGQKGSKEDFLRNPYPHLTEAGIEKAIKVESEDEPELNKERFESELTHFQSKKGESDEFKNMSGMDPSEVEGEAIWYNATSNQLHYAHLSTTGHPICRFSWKPGSRNELIFGVPRISVPEATKRIWFVEDHLQAVTLCKYVDDPVLVRPTEKALQWNDYEKVVAGLDVICLLGDDVGEYDYTCYPLINAVSSKAEKWTNVYYSPLTGGVPFPKWLTSNETNIAKLTQEVERSSGNATQAITKQVYNSFIRTDLHKRLHFPQDTEGDMFWYGTVEGKLVHSAPINRMAPDEILSKKNLLVDADDLNQIQVEGIRLTDSELMNILTSHGQLKPWRVYHLLKELIERHVFLANEHLSSLIALWIIGGYVYKLFPAYSYLRLNGRHGSGKTTLLDIIAACGFNGKKENDITKAGIAEFIHYLSCTLCLDEMEEKSNFSKADYVELLKAGYKRDGSRSKKLGKNVINLNVYSPKVIASIDPLGDAALDSRTLTIRTILKPHNIMLENWDMNVGDTAREVTIIRRGCYTFGLWHHKSIERLYRKVPASIQLPSGMILENRERQIVAPLIAVAQLIDTNGFSDAENSLLKALDSIWNSDYKEVQKSMELFYEQLCQWSEEPSFVKFRVENDMLYLDNELFDSTSIAKHLGGQPKVLAWLNTLPGVVKEGKYLKYFKNNRSCTGFPLNLKVHKKTVREIFSSKIGVK